MIVTKYPIILSEEERRELESMIRRGESSARTQTRARILLLRDESQGKPKTTKEISSALLCSLPTITSIRQKHAAGGLPEALYARERPGQKPKIAGEVEAQLTCYWPTASHWLGKHAGHCKCW